MALLYRMLAGVETRAASGAAMNKAWDAAVAALRAGQGEYSGKAIMKTKDTEERYFAFGEIPPTAMQHVDLNTVDAVRVCFKNAIVSGGKVPGNIEPRMNATSSPA